MQFQKKLQLLRKEKGFSQEKLAEKIGVSRQAVAKWEVGQSYPDMGNLIFLSELFGITIDRLVKDSTDENCHYGQSSLLETVNESVIDFLIRSKKSTYAAHGAETAPSRPDSHDLCHQEGKLKYLDTYLGGEKFAGEEALWLDDKPFWAMNYAGRILAEGFSGDFLKECLLLVPKEYPFRGPLVHRNGDYSYHCVVHGEFEWYNGYEEIFLGSTKVYECFFHGGSIK
ncbi:MAG: helix-turn-helix transcriptional regulator [Thermoclostridium sp.]|nr:helix-turn-helix transcriptional regulator [Thermoclostridium sp.]